MNKRSITVSVIFIYFFSAILLVLLPFAPFLVERFARLRGFSAPVTYCILYSFYLCAIPAAVALYSLGKLLYNIRRGRIFEKHNLKLLNTLSWCALAVTVLTLCATYHYIPFFFVSVAMFFMFLIIRAVGICMSAGTELKEENNLTI